MTMTERREEKQREEIVRKDNDNRENMEERQ